MKTESPSRSRVSTVPVCLPPKMVAALDEAAAREGEVSRSALIRRACRQLLDSLNAKQASRPRQGGA